MDRPSVPVLPPKARRIVCVSFDFFLMAEEQRRDGEKDEETPSIVSVSVFLPLFEILAAAFAFAHDL